MITISDVEWMLSDSFDVFQRDGLLFIEAMSMLGIAATHDFVDDTPVVRISFRPGEDLEPSSALYRWVAVTAGKFTLGTLSASLTDEGRVDVWFRHSLFDSTLEPQDLTLVVTVLADSARELQREVTSLFG